MAKTISCTCLPVPSDAISMLVDSSGTFFTTSVPSSALPRPHLCSSEVLPGGIEAVVGAHGVMSEKLPSVSTIRSGICQTHQETVSSHTQLLGTHTQPKPPVGAALHRHQLELPRVPGKTLMEVKLWCVGFLRGKELSIKEASISG